MPETRFAGDGSRDSLNDRFVRRFDFSGEMMLIPFLQVCGATKDSSFSTETGREMFGLVIAELGTVVDATLLFTKLRLTTVCLSF